MNTRRDFIKSSLAAAAIAQLPDMAVDSDSPSSTDKQGSDKWDFTLNLFDTSEQWRIAIVAQCELNKILSASINGEPMTIHETNDTAILTSEGNVASQFMFNKTGDSLTFAFGSTEVPLRE